MKYGLTDTQLEGIRRAVYSVPEVSGAILYGSRARGTYKPYSDIDLTLVGNNITISQLAIVEQRLDDLLMPYFVDLSAKKSLRNPDLIANIERDGVML